MRTWGRDSTGAWIEITETGRVWFATLVQTLRLGQGESPFYGGYGIPAAQSVITQIAPDAAVAIGDSENDALAGRAAGMATLTVPYGYNHGKAIQTINSDGIVDSLRVAARAISAHNAGRPTL